MGKLTISMAMFHNYVELPEGTSTPTILPVNHPLEKPYELVIFPFKMFIFHSYVSHYQRVVSHEITLKHRFPMIFPWFSHGFPMVMLDWVPRKPWWHRHGLAETAWWQLLDVGHHEAHSRLDIGIDIGPVDIGIVVTSMYIYIYYIYIHTYPHIHMYVYVCI